MTEAVRKRGDSALQFSENPFDSVPVSVATHLKSEANSGKRSLNVLSTIDEKFEGFDIVFLLQFAKENFRERVVVVENNRT